MDKEEDPVPLPSAPTVQLAANLTLQPPLTRRGHGPGLIILVSSTIYRQESESLDPKPLQKWAEEGYAVVEIVAQDAEFDFSRDVKLGIQALVALKECDETEKLGLIIYTSSTRAKIGEEVESNSKIVSVISYDSSLSVLKTPTLFHQAGKASFKTQPTSSGYSYPEAASGSFIIPGHNDFLPSPAAVAHTRSLTFLKKHMEGPYFDLEAIWDEHTEFEFGNRSVANTMGTMVQEPYVNHIPTVSIGRSKLSNFYRYHFIWNNPSDTALELVSRTVGIDRVIDEFVMTFTHNTFVDWLIPGIPPTGKKVRFPMTSVVNVRGDRLYHEHIAWDQTTVLVQLGLMPEYLPFPYPLPGGKIPAPGKRFEYRVPAAGVETAMKLVDETSVASNAMFEFSVREVDDK